MRVPPTDKYDEKGGYAPPLKPGTYKVRVAKVSEMDKDDKQLTNKAGFDIVLFEFDVSGYKGNKLFERFCFDMAYEYYPQTMGKFKQLQMACHVDTTVEHDTDSMVGKICMAEVKNTDSNGTTYNNIKAYQAFDAASDQPEPEPEPPQPSDDDDLPF